MSSLADLEKSASVMEREIRALLPASNVSWKAETGSTNEDARAGALRGAPSESVFGAEVQTRGRGRLERHWSTGAGESVEMSTLFRPTLYQLQSAGFSFAAALGIADGVEALSGLKPQIKWPNDVVVDGRKICGILCESATMGTEAAFMVVGTGINVNQETFPEEIARRASSLYLLSGKRFDRARVAAACIRSIIFWAGEYMHGGLSALMAAYCEKSAVLGREVEVLQSGAIYAGQCVGFNAEGAIMVDGIRGLQVFHANDVSLRGAGLHV